MRLTSEEVQLQKKLCEISEMNSANELVRQLIDTIEALQQENAELKHALMVDLKTGTIRELELLQGKAVLVLPDMPEGCAECWILSQNDLGYACAFLHKLIKYETLKQGKRRGDCPLRQY